MVWHKVKTSSNIKILVSVCHKSQSADVKELQELNDVIDKAAKYHLFMDDLTSKHKLEYT